MHTQQQIHTHTLTNIQTTTNKYICIDSHINLHTHIHPYKTYTHVYKQTGKQAETYTYTPKYT